MQFSFSFPSSSSFLSFIAVPLLVSLALCVHAAPASGSSSNLAVKQAVLLSHESGSSSSGNQFSAKASENDTSPWNEVHRVALPRPASAGVVNTTTVSDNVVTTNITTPAGKHIVTNSTVQAFHEAIRQSSSSSSKSKVSAAAKQASASTSSAHPSLTSTTGTSATSTSQPEPSKSSSSCFPALDFAMPSDVPTSLKGWWCDPSDEYGFMGFSYGVDACQSQKQLTKDFKDARKTFNARYVRLYSVCDDDGFYDRVINAAWEAGIGVQALIWFGFDGTDIYKSRRAALFKSIRGNAKAKFVTRAIQFGSEPLYDYAISGTDLAKEVLKAKRSMASLGINITVSEMAYGYQTQADQGSADVLKAVDFIDAHMLPYFAQDASTGGNAWHNNANDMKYFTGKAPTKKVYWSQTGWPSSHDCNAGVCPNSSKAVSSVKNEQAYFDLLDSKCTTLKAYPGGGVGWFAHMYSDEQGPGYGIYDYNGKLKFPFAPKTSC